MLFLDIVILLIYLVRMFRLIETVLVYVVSRLVTSSNPYSIIKLPFARPFVLLVVSTDCNADSLEQGLEKRLSYNFYIRKLSLNIVFKSSPKHSN